MTITVDLGDGRIVEFPDVEAAQKFMSKPSEPAPKERGLLGRVADWMAGSNRRDDIPTALTAGLNLSPAQSAQMTSLLATTASDDRLQAGLSKIEPSAQYDRDEFGNLIAIFPQRDDEGKESGRVRFYPNPQGLDLTDVMQGAGAATLATGVGKVAQLLGAPVSGLAGGGLLGGTEAAVVEGLSSRLTDQPFKVSDIPLGAAGGAIGGAAAARIERALAKPAATALDGASDEVSTAIKRMVAQGVDPDEAARMATAQSLPVKVPLTSGQITGSKSQQLFEDMARSGAYGEVPERIMQSQRVSQQEAIRQNIPAIQEYLAKGATSGDVGMAGASAQQVLAGSRKAAEQQAGSLYKAARAASGGVNVSEDAALAIGSDVLDAISEYSPRTSPGAAGLATDFAKMLDEGASVRQLFDWRSQITKHAQSGGPEGSAAAAMRQAFDNRMAQLADDSLLQGDEAAAKLWSEAIKNYREFSNTWRSKGGILSALTETTVRDGDTVLKVAPEAASNYIFGASSNNLVSKPALARDLRKLKDFLPVEQWNNIRQEAFLRIASKGEGGVESGQRAFSGVKFQKFWQDATRKNPEVIATLFNAEERKLIGEFASVASRATSGAVNASNSATAAAGALQKVVGAIGSTNAAQFATRLAGLNMLRSASGAVRALGAVSGQPTRPVTSFVGAGTGGALLSSGEVGADVKSQAARTIGLAQ